MLLALHVLMSIVLILLPALPENSLTRVYKRYTLIGPFFSEGVIESSNLLYVSWKQNGKWTAPANPTLRTYHRFFEDLNPSLHYRSSLERDIYERALVRIDSSESQSEASARVKYFQDYVRRRYVPKEADSIKAFVIRETSKDFILSRDTLTSLQF